MSDLKPGIYSGLNHADLPDGLSPSGAKTLAFDTPAKYRWKRQHPEPATKAMVLGRLLHSLVLEGESNYLVCADGRTAQGKEDKARCVAEGLVPASQKEADQIEGMAQAICDHELAAETLSSGKAEQCVIWTDERTGIACRGFIDWLRVDLIADLKSTTDASRDGFGKQAANLGYDIQSWMYREAIRQLLGNDLPFRHVVVESHAPYQVAVHQLPPEADMRGEQLARQALDTYAECVKSGHWPGYSPELIDTAWPYWAIPEIEEMEVA